MVVAPRFGETRKSTILPRPESVTLFTFNKVNGAVAAANALAGATEWWASPG
jgi:hypothetical protein